MDHMQVSQGNVTRTKQFGDPAEVFTRIYHRHHWGGVSPSGPGSDPKLLHSYLDFLGRIISEKRVTSVVDIGCGDWALAQKLDWQGVEYTGIDIVSDIVSKLNENFGRDHVRFLCADALTSDLPFADLCIMKDVLQHLSNASVHTLLGKLTRRFKYALLTNDVSHRKKGGWRTGWKTSSLEANCDIANGGYRPLRLMEAPFHLSATRLKLIPLRFKREVFGSLGTVLETKEVLWWENEMDPRSQIKKPYAFSAALL
jgi:SAM-dependent methyltransferase